MHCPRERVLNWGFSFLSLQKMQEQSNFDSNEITWGTAWAPEKEEPSSLFRKLLLQRGGPPQAFWWQLLTKLSTATLSSDTICNLRYSPVASWAGGHWLRDLFPKPLLLFQLRGKKKQFAGQIVSSSDLPACYFKDTPMNREIKLGVYKQNE